MLVKSEPPSASKAGRVNLTAQNFAKLSGREEMSENKLRTGQNRFLMHRSYTEEAQGNVFEKVDEWKEV